MERQGRALTREAAFQTSNFPPLSSETLDGQKNGIMLARIRKFAIMASGGASGKVMESGFSGALPATRNTDQE
jgi:hypothetical protein